jgi:pimeloyl-ACP methyl ester carboxylesterase
MRRIGLLVLVSALLAAAWPAGADGRTRQVVSRAVSFSVQNVNASKIPCPQPDGATYDVKGHLTGPAAALRSKSKRRAATLYVHGLGFGEWFWNFGGAPGYNYAQAQAKAGHVSVTIDRLGYDASGHPEGNRTCLGTQASIAHQIISALRKGRYGVEGGSPVRFRRVAIAGHSAGGEVANIEASSFKDVDGLIVMSFSYSNLPRAQLALGPTRDTCLRGGEPAEPGGPSGYAFFGQPSAADFEAIMFHSASRAVRDAANQLRNRDPCGDISSIIPALLAQQGLIKTVKVPVLVICGRNDALYSSLGCAQQRERYTRSRSTRLELVKNAGHALTLESTASVFRKKVGAWLEKHGF